MPDDDPRLTKELLSTARVIAKGHRIRDVARLVQTYGGEAKNWRKVASRPFMTQPGKTVELHWYEHHGIGRFELKEVSAKV